MLKEPRQTPFLYNRYEMPESNSEDALVANPLQTDKRQDKNFLRAFRNNQFTLVVGTTGRSLTSRIVQLLAYDETLLKSGKVIACTQLRRDTAKRMAQSIGDKTTLGYGTGIGHAVRFDKNTTDNTQLSVMSSGTLLQEVVVDNVFSKYSAIIIDEAHERTISNDLLMCFLRLACQKRKDLKVVILSAVEVKTIQTYFDNAPLVKFDGLIHDVKLHYCEKPQEKYVEATAEKVAEIHETKGSGDILVFLPGETDIYNAISMIKEKCKNLTENRRAGPVNILPLHTTLPPKKISQATSSRNHDQPGRKVIVSTNLAEAGYEIKGIHFVVDSGYVKAHEFDPSTSTQILSDAWVSKTEADQRASCAGRTSPGEAYRMYTKKEFSRLRNHATPEILRADLTNHIFFLLSAGVTDIGQFPFLERPSALAVHSAMDTLVGLGVMETSHEFTALGRDVRKLPLAPKLAKMLIESEKEGCSEQILDIVAMMAVPPVLNVPTESKEMNNKVNDSHSKYKDKDSYGLTLLKVFRDFLAQQESDRQAWCEEKYFRFTSLENAREVRLELLGKMTDMCMELTSGDDKSVRKAMFNGMYMQTAFRHYKSMYRRSFDSGAKDATVHHTSTLYHVYDGSREWVDGQWIVFDGCQELSGNLNLMGCTKVDQEWVYEKYAGCSEIEQSLKESGAYGRLFSASVQHRPNTTPNLLWHFVLAGGVLR
ncbi:P-loop containing nucleoside triphosphate hydrolase protein [Hesseltinella vesiculosa]|uniref:RNA helicase n=1 Tax=Hesseltinella vesiculosa TaxID=101127 RepID=A0A1X2GF00_9FUNG|nr:P-loop containing nucleoside triphosphate hydrolase protein [Hesseltinella vesiculosa]